jgi:hypothetical protein
MYAVQKAIPVDNRKTEVPNLSHYSFEYTPDAFSSVGLGSLLGIYPEFLTRGLTPKPCFLAEIRRAK